MVLLYPIMSRCETLCQVYEGTQIDGQRRHRSADVFLIESVNKKPSSVFHDQFQDVEKAGVFEGMNLTI